MARREIKPLLPKPDKKWPEKPKMDPTAAPDPDEIEQLKAEHPVTARIATESIPRKPKER